MEYNSPELGIISNNTGVDGGNGNDLIWVDPGRCCFVLYSKLNADKVLLQQSPLALPKALKVINTYEIFRRMTVLHIVGVLIPCR